MLTRTMLDKADGVTVRPFSDPEGRGGNLDNVEAIVVHDTVTTRSWSPGRVNRLCAHDGTENVPPPLYQVGIDRDGVVHFLAGGRANHNGHGTYGNDSIGVAFYAAGALEGREEPASARQQETAARVCVALCRELGLDAGRVVGHKETDPDRKQDPYGVDMVALRVRVEELLADEPEDEPEDDEEDDVATDVVVTDEAVYLIDHPYRVHVGDPEAAEYFKNLAASKDNPQYEGPYEWDEDRVQFHPEKG